MLIVEFTLQLILIIVFVGFCLKKADIALQLNEEKSADGVTAVRVM